MRRIAGGLTVILGVLALLWASGCSKPAEMPSRSLGNPKEPTIGVCLTSLDSPWRTERKADIETAIAKHPDLRLTIRDAKNSAARQQAQIEKFVADRVKAIIICPVDAQTLAEPVARAFEAGIPVVVLDRALVGNQYSCFITTDWTRIGREAGRWLAGRLRGRGKIVEIKGPVDSLAAQRLHEGFRSMLREPGYRFVYAGAVDPPKTDGAKVMHDALERVGEIDAVFAWDDTAARSAYEAAKTAGREKGILWIGVGGLAEKGLLRIPNVSVLRPTGGAEAVDAAVQLMHGKTVPAKIVLETRVLTR